MKVDFKDHDLDRLETDREFTGGFPREVVTAYRKKMQQIRAAIDERDLYAIRSHRFKKLKGKRSHQSSMRLNDQWRLIVEIEKQEFGNVLWIVEICDYH
ncbi:type II toxin-antitoxin system RelE/ParE family toxin [Candidatus Sumerlaeota bacterium]|nr:type II toxin-antitoxin system RelE/ParE family toxin [Candidatus Sumerlaeota bacterium]